MPTIGEIRSAKEIDRRGHAKFIWQPCVDCQTPRWVEQAGFLKGEYRRCKECIKSVVSAKLKARRAQLAIIAALGIKCPSCEILTGPDRLAKMTSAGCCNYCAADEAKRLARINPADFTPLICKC